MVVGCALLVNVSVALVVVAVCGLNVTVNGALWPFAIVSGKLSPPTLNSELFVLAPLNVTSAPLARIVPDTIPLLPTTTLPASSVAGDTVRVPTVVEVPVPDSETVEVAFTALLETVATALYDPAAEGANSMLSVALCPEPIVTGKLGPVTEKPCADTVAPLIVSDAVPEFVAVTLKVLLDPAATLPKLKLPLASDRSPLPWFPEPPPALTPWQALSQPTLATSMSTLAVLHVNLLPSLCPIFFRE